MRDYRSNDERTAAVLARGDAYDDRYDGYEPDTLGRTACPAPADVITALRSAVAWAAGSWGGRDVTPVARGVARLTLGERDETDRMAAYLAWLGLTCHVEGGFLYVTDGSAGHRPAGQLAS